MSVQKPSILQLADQRDEKMKYLIAVLLLLPLTLTAGSKAKVKAYKNITLVKALIVHKSTNLEHIKHIEAFAGDKRVFNFHTNYYLSTNPMIKFAYKNQEVKSLTVQYSDNLGASNFITTTVKLSPKFRESKNIELQKKSAKVKLHIPVIKKMFGDVEFIESGIEVFAPDFAANSGAIPVSIRSEIDAKAVYLFAEQEGKEVKYICHWVSTESSIIDYHVKIKMDPHNYFDFAAEKRDSLFVIIESKEGEYYLHRKSVQTSLAGTNI